MQFTLLLSSPDLNLANAGGKGANLSALIRGGFAVPGGFVVTMAGYDAFVAANGLAAPIAARVEAIDAANPTAYDRASEEIRALFAQATLPDDLRAAVLTAYADAVPDGNPLASGRTGRFCPGPPGSEYPRLRATPPKGEVMALPAQPPVNERAGGAAGRTQRRQ